MLDKVVNTNKPSYVLLKSVDYFEIYYNRGMTEGEICDACRISLIRISAPMRLTVVEKIEKNSQYYFKSLLRGEIRVPGDKYKKFPLDLIKNSLRGNIEINGKFYF